MSFMFYPNCMFADFPDSKDSRFLHSVLQMSMLYKQPKEEYVENFAVIRGTKN